MPGMPANPTVPPNPPQVSFFVQQAVTAPTTQDNLRGMIGEVLGWNPEASSLQVTKWLNNAYRSIIRERLWYGTKVRGQVHVPDLYSTGTISLVPGEAVVVGNGTAWDDQFIGRQLRMGMTEPIGTVRSVEDPTHLTLDLPWGGYPHNNSAYRIFLACVSLGANIRRVEHMVNLRNGWKFRGVHVPHEYLQSIDPRRARVQQPFLLADYAVSALGHPIFELYPHPLVAQAFPWTGWLQPADLREDEDAPIAFIGSDILVNMAIAEALSIPGPRFNLMLAGDRNKRALYELAKLRVQDDNLAMQDLRWEFANYSYAPEEGESAQDREW